MRQLELEEIKEIEFEILCQVKDICEKQNIRYSLDGGTLLGAVRHGGFIPWDDDIDIMMPRPDYNRFVDYCSNNNTPFGLANHLIDPKFTDLSTKAFNYNTVCVENFVNRNHAEYGVYVDIFPIDGLGNSYAEAKRKLDQSLFKRNLLIAYNWQKFFRSRTRKWFYEPLRLIFYLISRFQNPLKLINKIESIYKDIDFDKVSYVGVVCGCYGDKEIMRRDIFEQYIKIQFNGEKFDAIKNYDEFLTNLYGNYMELPPVEKQITHHTFTAYYKN